MFIISWILWLFKSIIQIFVFAFKWLGKTLLYIIKLLVKCGLSLTLIYGALILYLWVAQIIVPQTETFTLYMLGFIPITIISIIIAVQWNKRVKARKLKKEQKNNPQPIQINQPQYYDNNTNNQSQKYYSNNIGNANQQYSVNPTNKNQQYMPNATEQPKQYRSLNNPNIIIFEYSDRLEKYQQTSKGLTLISTEKLKK